MIALLTGRVESVGDNGCILDVQGVGYRLFCSARTLRSLPRAGESARLFVEMHVREDHIHLYGFATDAERQWYLLLQTVQGVGAKVALAILSTLAPSELAQAIASGDKASLGRADGVGPKLAARLVTELRDKVGGMTLGPAAHGEGEARFEPVAMDGPAEDAVSALVNLGYKRFEAQGAVAKAMAARPDADLASLIRLSLKELTQ